SGYQPTEGFCLYFNFDVWAHVDDFRLDLSVCSLFRRGTEPPNRGPDGAGLLPGLHGPALRKRAQLSLPEFADHRDSDVGSTEKILAAIDDAALSNQCDVILQPDHIAPLRIDFVQAQPPSNDIFSHLLMRKVDLASTLLPALMDPSSRLADCWHAMKA